MSNKQAIFRLNKIVQLATVSSRAIHCSGLRATIVESKNQVAPGYIKIREKYKEFQIDDGTPVHFKAGTRDRILYYITLSFIGVGLIGTYQFFYEQAFPPKK